jgi:hypothetical protein
MEISMDEIINVDDKLEAYLEQVKLYRDNKGYIDKLHKTLSSPIKKDSIEDLKYELSILSTELYKLGRLKSKAEAQYRLAKFEAAEFNTKKGDNGKATLDGGAAHYSYVRDVFQSLIDAVIMREKNVTSLHATAREELKQNGKEEY